MEWRRRILDWPSAESAVRAASGWAVATSKSTDPPFSKLGNFEALRNPAQITDFS
jgi:hypothetical protein